MLNTLHPMRLITQVTRWLQARQPSRPLRGLTRFAALCARTLPAYQGTIRLPNGSRLTLDSRQKAERWLLFSGSYQPAVTAWLRAKTAPGAYCLDVGANLGFYTIQLAHWAGATGRVMGFEANPAMAIKVREQIAANAFAHAQIIERAVSDQPGSVTFHIATDPGKSSLQADHAATLAQVTVEATTLDAAVSAAGWSRLDVIKMDIEGHDCYGLRGAQHSLRQFRPCLVFEYSASTPPEVAAEVFDLLESLSYRLAQLRPDGTLADFDWRRVTSGHVDVTAEPR
jgi:FkbM family methyltransferase